MELGSLEALRACRCGGMELERDVEGWSSRETWRYGVRELWRRAAGVETWRCGGMKLYVGISSFRFSWLLAKRVAALASWTWRCRQLGVRCCSPPPLSFGDTLEAGRVVNRLNFTRIE